MVGFVVEDVVAGELLVGGGLLLLLLLLLVLVLLLEVFVVVGNLKVGAIEEVVVEDREGNENKLEGEAFGEAFAKAGRLSILSSRGLYEDNGTLISGIYI